MATKKSGWEAPVKAVPKTPSMAKVAKPAPMKKPKAMGKMGKGKC